MKKIVNGKEVNLTQIEINQRLLEEQEWENGKLDRAKKEIRDKRNQLLKDTDYILMPDYPKQDKSAFIQYRQALRDITNNINSMQDVDNLVWPVKPEL